MNLLEAKLSIDTIVSAVGDRASSMTFGVKIFSPGGLRKVPLATAKRIVRDIDLGASNVYVELEEEVSKISLQDREAIAMSVRRGGSWHAYQNHKRNAEKIQALQERLGKMTAILEAAGLPLPPEEPSLSSSEVKA